MLRLSLRRSFDKIFDNVLVELGKRMPRVDGYLQQRVYGCLPEAIQESEASDAAVLGAGRRIGAAWDRRVLPSQWSILCGPPNGELEDKDDEWRADSVRRKRKKKMNKHKHAKRRKLNRHKR